MYEQSSPDTVPAGKTFDKMTPFPEDAAVTMAYVPFQCDFAMYEEQRALDAGTLFKTLDKPFLRGAKI